MCVRACIANHDVTGPSVVASFHGNTSLRAQKGVETIMVVEGAEKGRAWDDECEQCEPCVETE